LTLEGDVRKRFAWVPKEGSLVTAITTKAWPVALLKAAHLSSIRGEGVDDAPSEANFKTKASKQGPTGIGGRWIVIVTRKRRVRSP